MRVSAALTRCKKSDCASHELGLGSASPGEKKTICYNLTWNSILIIKTKYLIHTIMTLPQTFAHHELLAKELQAHQISTTTPQHTVNLDSGEYSNTPELLVAAAWSITAAQWFYSSEVDFRVAIDKVRSIVPVQASVGPEVHVEDVLQQLKSQMGLGKTSGSEKDLSREFCIVYETGKGK